MEREGRGRIEHNEPIVAGDTPTANAQADLAQRLTEGSGPYSGTPFRPDDVHIDPLSAESGETPEQVAMHRRTRGVEEGELPPQERSVRGIIDNMRHSDSIGDR